MEKTLEELYKFYVTDQRRKEYEVYENLFMGRHYDAFSINAKEFTDQYSRLRYVVCNFAGLTSRVVSDMLFGEPVKIKDKDNQEFIDALDFENKLDVLNIEHATANSYFGDNLYKIRVENKIIKIEDNTPMVYFPELNKDNIRAEPKRIYLLWEIVAGPTTYFMVEMHEPPFVKMRIGQVVKPKDENSDILEMDIPTFNDLYQTSFNKEVDTKVDRYLVKHVPNPKARGHYGISDYIDMKPLLFALNNRMSKIDNVLDKHSDPILAVPEGVLDENGNIRREAFSMFEVPADGSQKPEYITWNANLEYAFKEIDKTTEFLFMFSETSPDVLGLGQGGGQAESGRALKMRLLRTIAKRNRKKLYYDYAIKDLVYTAELLSAANGYKASKTIDAKVKSPQPPTTEWEDGIVNDEVERTQIETMKVESGIQSKRRAIMSLEGVNEDEADEVIKEVTEEGKSAFDAFSQGQNNNDNNDNDDDSNKDDSNKADDKNNAGDK
jgi:hypothetical protein